MSRRIECYFAVTLLAAALAASAAFALPPSVEAAGVALRTGNASNAVSLATEALAVPDITPKDRARVLVDRGLAYEQLKQFDAALADLTEAINAHVLPPAEQSHALYDRGVVLDETGRTDDAIGDYSTAIDLDPRFAMALNNRANANRRLGRFDAAKTDYMLAIATGGAHLEYPNYGLGQIAETEHRLDDARSYYRAAIAADPQFTLALDRLRALGGDLAEAHPASVRLQQPPVRTAASPPPVAAAMPSPTAPSSAAQPRAAAGVAATVQLGAWRSEAEASAAFTHILAQSGDVLAGVTPKVVAVDLPGRGRFYRLRAAVGDGAGVCAALAARRLACMLARD